jgi:eukaryotic-like serine/threonine-protein kinase
MATMFGRFEVQSELSKSETAQIYKALDTETNQVVALKTQSLEPLGERAAAFVETLIAEGESTRDLAGQNIALLYGAGEIDGQFCAAMEYIQGNSIATMLARKEGFSIWDLLDITRQVCAGLEHAAAKNVAHCSLEPDKILVQWDGMVKILGYGISNMSLIEAESGKGLGRMMPYCSPEQIRGEAIDLRSNLFTVGTILYEMVVGRKAFDAADPGTLLTRIENEMPPSPSEINAKIQPAVSALIMKALAKNPAERYQSARALLEDLETCKENGKKAAVEPKKAAAAAAPKIAVDPAARAAAANKFVSANAANAAAPALTVPSASPKPVSQAPAKPAAANPVSPRVNVSVPSPTRPAVETKAAAAAAGATTGGGAYGVSQLNAKAKPSDSSSKTSTSGARLISDFEVSSSASQSAASPAMSAAAPIIEPEPAPTTPRVAVDPMMAAPANASSGTSFSDLAEMPPLKERVISTSFAEPEAPLPAELLIQPKKKEEKPKVEVRQAAQKAMQEISTIPPRLMIYSILGAVGLILVVVVALFFHVRSEDDGSTAAPRPTKVAESKPAPPPVAQAPAAPRAETPVPPITEPQPDLNVRPVEKVEKHVAKVTRRAPAPAPVVIPGQALIDSTPQGAQFQVDGKSDPSWITPFSLINLAPGKHIISISKAGYSSDIRSVEVASGSKSSLVLHLSAINALIAVNSTPPGAEVIIDGKPTGRVTPAQFAVEKGSHTIFLRKQGYLDETTVADLGPAQNFQYAPTLRALGNTEDMKTLGKFNKLFGHGGEGGAGMGSIVIRTQPKGAQVAINQRILDKTSPAGVAVEPGNYVVDVTMTGFKPIHKVINLEKGGKAVIDEVLERQ